MPRTRTLFLSLCVLALVTAACGKTKDSGFPPPATGSPSEAPCSAGDATPVDVTGPIKIVDSAFAPQNGKVAAGTKVDWSQCGSAPHTVTSATGSTVKFDSSPQCPADTVKCLGTGGEFSFTFTKAGTYTYYCKIHGTPDGKNGMVGTIVVT